METALKGCLALVSVLHYAFGSNHHYRTTIGEPDYSQLYVPGAVLDLEKFVIFEKVFSGLPLPTETIILR